MFRNFMRLLVDKWGSITLYDDKGDGGSAIASSSFSVKSSNNLSLVEYECVVQHDNNKLNYR